MKVLVTGATGFVGAHTTAALIADGHTVRAFVRSREKLERSLAPLETEPGEVAVGDVLDAASVRDAVSGCDSIVNAANIYRFSTLGRDEMHRVNLTGTESVLSAAVEAGCNPVVHISSMVALLPSDGPIPADPPLGSRSGNAYCDSKIDAEEVARRFQAEGAPVVTVYPGQVFGPHDPGAGEMVKISRLLLGPIVPGLKGSIAIVDVRWLAQLHALLATSEPTVQRVVAPGHYLGWEEFARTIRDLAGQPPPRFLPTPLAVAELTGLAAQFIGRMIRREVGLNPTGPWISANWRPADDSIAIGMVGEMPPLDVTLTDALRSMVAAGQLTAGAVASL